MFLTCYLLLIEGKDLNSGTYVKKWLMYLKIRKGSYN